MAVKGLTALTLADWGKRVDPNGKVDKIIELLGQTKPDPSGYAFCRREPSYRTPNHHSFWFTFSYLAFAELWRTAKQINHSTGNRFRWHAGNLCGSR